MLVEMGDENYFNTDVEDNIVRRFKGLEDLSPLPFPPDDLTQKHAWRYLRIKIETEHIRKGGKWNQSFHQKVHGKIHMILQFVKQVFQVAVS